MLNMYLSSTGKEVMYNDAFFDLALDNIKFDTHAQVIMKEIDGVKYSGGNRFYSKFNKETQVSVTELSTGCKTALNIYLFPNRIFYVGECGSNALDIILGMKNGSIFVTDFFIPAQFTNSIKIIHGDRNVIINNDIELLDIFEKVGLN